MEEKKDLIIVKQLPIIEERLKQLSKEIDEKVEKASGLICTEENKTVVKELRANLNKEFAEYETQRKEVKQKVLEPYNQFEKAYKENVSDKYKEADKLLKEKINEIDEQQKKDKENELRAYFYECRSKHNNMEFIAFENVGLNITLSASKASLERKVEEFIDKVASDLDLINTQQNKEEIFIEYKKHLNVSKAITDVVNRKEQLKRLEEQRVETELEQEKKIIQDNLSNLANANVGVDLVKGESQEVKTYTITFKVTGTVPRLKQLKDYLIKEGYQYE